MVCAARAVLYISANASLAPFVASISITRTIIAGRVSPRRGPATSRDRPCKAHKALYPFGRAAQRLNPTRPGAARTQSYTHDRYGNRAVLGGSPALIINATLQAPA